VQSFSGPSPQGLRSNITVSDSKASELEGPSPCFCISQEQDCHVILVGTGFHFGRSCDSKDTVKVFEPASTRGFMGLDLSSSVIWLFTDRTVKIVSNSSSDVHVYIEPLPSS
jgi:hypothetical protein